MDTITETSRPLEQASVFATSIYQGGQRFVRAVTETLSQLSADQIKRGALVAGLTIESFIITDLTPYQGNPVLEAFRNNHTLAQVQIDQPLQDQAQVMKPQIEISEAPKESIPPYLKSFAQNPERIKNTLRWKNMMEQIVADKRLQIPQSERSYWVNHMLKIIFIESGGKEQASSGIAFGLTQLKDSTADEIAKAYQIPEYDIYKNAWDNAFLATAYQLKLAKWYGPELAVWTHHLGTGNMNLALRTYLISNLKLPIATVDDFFNDANKLSQAIKEYHITPQALLSSPAVTAQLKSVGAWGDLTWEYYPRYQAAGVAMNSG